MTTHILLIHTIKKKNPFEKMNPRIETIILLFGRPNLY